MRQDDDRRSVFDLIQGFHRKRGFRLMRKIPKQSQHLRNNSQLVRSDFHNRLNYKQRTPIYNVYEAFEFDQIIVNKTLQKHHRCIGVFAA